MIKKMVFAATAAAALSVPLAGLAWAEPPAEPGSKGIGEGGMPQRLGDFAFTGVNPPLATSNSPIPPGEEFNLAKDYSLALHQGEKVSTPTALAEFESFVWTNPGGAPRTLVGVTDPIPSDVEDWTNITPGLAIKPLTPGCGKGRTGLPDNAPNCVP